MKKMLLFSILTMSLVLVSCGSKKTSPIVAPIDADTPIENKEQAMQVCAPFVKYLECSLEKAPPARKNVHEDILQKMRQKIDSDAPDKVAQQCDTYIKILKKNPDVAFKNGCALEEATPSETSTIK